MAIPLNLVEHILLKVNSLWEIATPSAYGGMARNDSDARFPLAREWQSVKRHHYCHCEERSDVAIPLNLLERILLKANSVCGRLPRLPPAAEWLAMTVMLDSRFRGKDNECENDKVCLELSSQ